MMNKRSLLIGFGLGVLLAGLVSLFMFNARGFGAPPMPYPDAAESSDADTGDAQYIRGWRDGWHSYGWHGHHWGMWGFPFMMLRCLWPLLLIGLFFAMFRMFRRRQWHHRHTPPQPPTV